nr:uncharacterized protein LOC111509895 [Leptinotarsa decemlineata]
MSHNPRQNYGYPQLPPDYYVDDPEGFVSDYSDSDALSENQRQSFGVAPPRHLPEIYDRNTLASHQMITSKQQYSSQPYIQQYYHNRNLPQIPRTQSAIPPQTYPHPYNNSLQRHFYPSEEINYDYAGSQQKVMAQMQQYKSAMRKVPDPASYNVMSKQTNPKRYPVTVGTPKYYRKPPVNSIYKRPSALCLPVASQPDPAAYRRPKRAPVFNDQTLYGMQQEIPSGMENPSLESPVDDGTKDQIDAVLVPHKVDSEGDVDAKISNFEELLAKFERENGPKKTKSRNDISKISKFLKPRVRFVLNVSGGHDNISILFSQGKYIGAVLYLSKTREIRNQKIFKIIKNSKIQKSIKPNLKRRMQKYETPKNSKNARICSQIS